MHLPPEDRALACAGAMRALAPGGLLVMECFTPAQEGRRSGGPKDDAEDLALDVWAGVVPLALAASALVSAPAHAQKPLKIGFSMALTGGLAGAGKAALIAMEIWREDVNKKGGLLGRPVEFVYYDDATQPAKVPPIYTKLLNVDKVDLVVSSYGTNEIAPAMPIVMRKKLVFPSLFGLAVNDEFKYDRYFQIMPAGPEPKTDWS